MIRIRGLSLRYTLFRYAHKRYAVDCNDCEVKIANLNSNTISKELLDRLEVHELAFHATEEKPADEASTHKG